LNYHQTKHLGKASKTFG